MTDEVQENTENYIFNEFSLLWRQLTHNQQRYAVARLGSSSKKEAAEAIGLEPQTVYRWDDVVDQVIDLMLQNEGESAITILTAQAVRAAMTKQEGLDSDDERIKQAVATEILDRVLGRATQRQEITGQDGEAIVFAVSGIDLEKDI